MKSRRRHHQGQLLDKSQASQNTKIDKPQPSEQQVNEVLMNLNGGRLKEAEQAAILLTDNFPEHFFGWQALGLIFGRTGRIIEATHSFERSVALNPSDPATHNNLGVYLRDLGRIEDSILHYLEAIRLQPNYPEAHNNLGNGYRDSGKLQEAEYSFRRALQFSPNFAQALSNLGNVLVDLGRLDEAEASYRQAINSSPGYANAYNNLGNVLKLLGRLGEAEDAYREAIRLNPDHVNALNNLGNVLRERGQQADAIATFGMALRKEPNFPEVHNNLGNVLHDVGRFKEAVQHYEAAIRLKPDYAEAQNNCGNSYRELGNYELAVRNYTEAIRLKPDYAEAHSNLGGALSDVGQYDEAECQYLTALQLKPQLSQAQTNLGWLLLEKREVQRALACGLTAFEQTPSHTARRLIVQCLSLIQIEHFDRPLAELALQALEETWDRPTQLVRFSQELLLQEPHFRAFVDRLIISTEITDLEGLTDHLPGDQLFNRLFELTLTSAPLSSAIFERFLTKLRAHLLKYAVCHELEKLKDAGIRNLLSVLARQCYINEYVYASLDWELHVVLQIQEMLCEKLRHGELIDENVLLLLGCYEPLSVIPHHERLLGLTCSESLRCVLEQQIREPQIELSLRASIPRLTSIEDDVSLSVQTQYEENPYPRWVRLPRVWEPKPINQRIRDLFPHSDFTPLIPDLLPAVLIAGCGSGQQPIEVAGLLKNCDVLAVDLSMASLAYAKRKSLESCVNNISFAQADILKLGELHRKFDVIESGGVLHHMRDPFAAWDVLLSSLKPNGLMKLGLYSEIARRHVVRLREMIAEAGLGQSRSEIAAFRQKCLESTSAQDYGWAVRSPDFFSTSGCRDLLFHVHEHRMTLPIIEKYLNQRSLKFLGFEIDHSVIMAYQHHFPGDKAAAVLSNWDVFENENPDIFQGMYQFWIQKV